MWWTSHPVIYTLDDYEGHRIRFLAAEKAAYCGTQILQGTDEWPSFMGEINPGEHYPLYVDRQLVCHGAAMEELLHERYPSPTLLPVDPVKRAQVRMLTMEVRSWYDLDVYVSGEDPLKEKLAEFADSFDTSVRYFCGGSICAVDIAVAPLLFHARNYGWQIGDKDFNRYVDRLLNRESFKRSLLTKTTPAPVVEPEVADELETI
jgi:RNA polymerase-associated protein